MGTEILRAQDSLMKPAPILLPRRRFNPNPIKFFRKEPSLPPAARRRREGSPKPSKPVMGQVTILKRGQMIDSEGTVFGSGRLGPEPAMMPKQIRLVCAHEEAGDDGYAGSAFSMSPSPRALPLPSFSRRANAMEYSATMDLRRLLQLE